MTSGTPDDGAILAGGTARSVCALLPERVAEDAAIPMRGGGGNPDDVTIT
ncbi:hypothetical protein [Rhizobium mesoamericanum]|nr:hypothetical protein [Rhizobium mesoamericanum]